MNYKPAHILMLIFVSFSILAQPENYDENSIQPYVLPELLVLNNGEEILNSEAWESKRRPQILELFKEEIYGYQPKKIAEPSIIEIIEASDSALNNTALRKQIAITFKGHDKQITINVLLYLPKGVSSPPVLVGYNFFGNHTVIDDPNIKLTESWVMNNIDFGITENLATEGSRGIRNYRWPIKKILNGGFGVVTIHYGDVDPDMYGDADKNNRNFTDGVHPLFYEEGQEKPKDNEWGAISAWAWGISRVLDYLETDESLLNSKFISFGHSRLGKTSLWAGALDKRIDIVISNNSGCGGAAIFRRRYGETVSLINRRFPHWFNQNFKKYNDNENLLPIDQHMLIALIAPRPVYIASAEEDRWSDPKGEYLSGFHASPVYELYGKQSLLNSNFPSINDPIHTTIGYHIRAGKHDVTDYDWEQFMLFANKHFEADH